MSDFLAVRLQQAIHFTIGTISTVLNLAIIYCILFKTPKYMRQYSYFLFHITFSDFIFNFYFTFLCQPMPLFPIWAVLFNGPIGHLMPAEQISIPFHIAMYLFAYCIVSINFAFFYRHLLVRKSKLLKLFMSKWAQIMLALLISMAIGAVIWVHRSQMYTKEFPYDPPAVYVYKRNPPLECLVLICLPVFTACNGLMAQRIFAQLRVLRSTMLTSTYRMNRSMTYALIVQTLTPIILFCLPLVGVFYAVVTESKQVLSIGFGMLLVAMLSLNSIANALSTLYFVKSYRRVIKSSLLQMLYRVSTKK